MSQNIEDDIARIIATDSDPQVALNLPPNATVHFRGRPILALDPLLNNRSVPARFRRHPLVHERYFCTMPADFWNDVIRRVGRDRFNAELVELESQLSHICGDHSQIAGFRNGLPITYCLHRQPADLRIERTQAAEWDKNQAQLDHLARTLEERAATLARPGRAYTGWLMSNTQFLGEFDGLLETWAPMVRRWGFDRLGILLPTGMFLPGDDPTVDERWDAYREAFGAFFTRWRLRGMAAPYLPVPLEPLMSGVFPVSILPQLMNSCGVFVLPDIYPIPSRDQLRGMLDDALHRSTEAEHLAEWRRLIARDNAAKKVFAKYARLFEIQHYMRLLHQRHAEALQRKLTPVKDAFAGFLGTNRRTIDEDLVFLKKRLGPDWLERGREVS